ncbi:MAG: AraC family transcriptional regulator [Firmicutes bacterium]|nr:AraC family transcriptional regulator [Bacillota bacterium]
MDNTRLIIPEPGEKILIFKRKYDRSEIVKPHTHDFIEIVYILKGKGVEIINDKSVKVARGDLLFYNISDIHCLNSDSSVTAINIQIFPQILDESLATSQNAMDFLTLTWFNDFYSLISGFLPKVTYRGKEFAEIEFVVLSMFEEFKNKRTGYMSVIFGYLNVLLGKLFRQIHMDTKIDLRQNVTQVADSVLCYIEKNYKNKITLNELATKSFYNPSYFGSIFKKCYGMTPFQYINKTRIKKAIEFLDTTGMSIDEVMCSVGYSDKKHFYSLFKQSTGLTPGQYRQKIKKNTTIV